MYIGYRQHPNSLEYVPTLVGIHSVASSVAGCPVLYWGLGFPVQSPWETSPPGAQEGLVCAGPRGDLTRLGVRVLARVGVLPVASVTWSVYQRRSRFLPVCPRDRLCAAAGCAVNNPANGAGPAVCSN